MAPTAARLVRVEAGLGRSGRRGSTPAPRAGSAAPAGGQTGGQPHDGVADPRRRAARPDLRLVHTTHLDATRGRTEHGVVHHQGPLEPEDCVRVDGVLVSPPSTAIAGEMLLTDQDAAIVVGDSAVNRGITSVDALRTVADDWLRYGDSRALRYRVSLIDGAAESAGESLSRQVFRRGGLPSPVLQYCIDGPDGFVAYADFAWPEHGVLGEFDGKEKYLRSVRADDRPGRRRLPGETARGPVARPRVGRLPIGMGRPVHPATHRGAVPARAGTWAGPQRLSPPSGTTHVKTSPLTCGHT